VALHLEVALSGAAPYLLADLQHADRFRRTAAVSTLAHHLAQRKRCFDIRLEAEESGAGGADRAGAGRRRSLLGRVLNNSRGYATTDLNAYMSAILRRRMRDDKGDGSHRLGAFIEP
jgi:hypothetical protein